MIWVNQSDRLALYPGGPLLGFYPGKFEAVAARVGVAVEAGEQAR